MGEYRRGGALQLVTLLLLLNEDEPLDRYLSRYDFDRFIRDLIDSAEFEIIETLREFETPIPSIAIVEALRRSLEVGRGTYESRRARSETVYILEKLDNLEHRLGQLRKFVGTDLAPKVNGLEDTRRSNIWSLAQEVDLATIPAIRNVPVRFYTKKDLSYSDQLEISQNIQNFLDSIGFELDLDLPGESGSYWKKFWVKTKNTLSHKQVEDRLRKVERAIETKHIEKPQAEANAANAKAFADIMHSISDMDDACIQLGNILIVKYTPLSTGKKSPKVVSRTLSALEMATIEQNQSLLKEPASILQQLESLCSASPEKSEQIDINLIKFGEDS